MRIELADILDVPAADVNHLGEHLIRFRLAAPLPVSPYHQLMLEGRTDLDSLFPGAPNRDGIQHNFAQLGRNLEAAFEANKGCEAIKRRGIYTPLAFLRFNVEHFCHPQFLYTNGQSLVSLVQGSDELFEVAVHASIDNFRWFGSHYGPRSLLDPEGVRTFSSRQAAETWVHSHLSALHATTVSLIRGGEQRALLLQPAGTIYTRSPVRTYLAYHDGGVVKLRIGPGEPYAFLNDFELDGFRAGTCATCRHFRFSGMSRSMSHGSKGYCGLRMERARAEGKTMTGRDTVPSSRLVVSVFDRCEAHEFIEDPQREIPYLAHSRPE
jgi:hypothetical protein